MSGPTPPTDMQQWMRNVERRVTRLDRRSSTLVVTPQPASAPPSYYRLGDSAFSITADLGYPVNLGNAYVTRVGEVRSKQTISNRNTGETLSRYEDVGDVWTAWFRDVAPPGAMSLLAGETTISSFSSTSASGDLAWGNFVINFGFSFTSAPQVTANWQTSAQVAWTQILSVTTTDMTVRLIRIGAGMAIGQCRWSATGVLA